MFNSYGTTRDKHTFLEFLLTYYFIIPLIIQRNGADHAVFINTGMEFEGSDAGASPNEAVSWGKIKATANPVKVNMAWGKTVEFMFDS